MLAGWLGQKATVLLRDGGEGEELNPNLLLRSRDCAVPHGSVDEEKFDHSTQQPVELLTERLHDQGSKLWRWPDLSDKQDVIGFPRSTGAIGNHAERTSKRT